MVKFGAHTTILDVEPTQSLRMVFETAGYLFRFSQWMQYCKLRHDGKNVWYDFSEQRSLEDLRIEKLNYLSVDTTALYRGYTFSIEFNSLHDKMFFYKPHCERNPPSIRNVKETIAKNEKVWVADKNGLVTKRIPFPRNVPFETQKLTCNGIELMNDDSLQMFDISESDIQVLQLEVLCDTCMKFHKHDSPCATTKFYVPGIHYLKNILLSGK